MLFFFFFFFFFRSATTFIQLKILSLLRTGVHQGKGICKFRAGGAAGRGGRAQRPLLLTSHSSQAMLSMFPKIFRHSRTLRRWDFGAVFCTEDRPFSKGYLTKDMCTKRRDSTHSVPSATTADSANKETPGIRPTISDAGNHEDGVSDEEQHLQDLQAKSLSFLAMVDEAALDPQQLAIHRAHVLALKVSGVCLLSHCNLHCPTPVCTLTHKNDHVRTLMTL